MWSNHRPPSRTAPGDHYNNNQGPPNPYSRTAGTPKPKPGRQSTDPWDWGWEDNSSAQQDDWNNGWNQAPPPAPNVIPNPAPPLYHPMKPDKKTHGTPDLIPEKANKINRGNLMQTGPPPPRYNQISNAKDFFDIDLAAQNHQSTPLPPMYNAPEIRRPQHPLTQDYPAFQQAPPQNRHQSPASYFRQVHPSQDVNNESMFYNQPPPSQSPNTFQNSQYYQPETIVNNQMTMPEYSNNHYGQNQLANYYDQNAFMNISMQSFEPVPKVNNSVEVENVEVAPPERVSTPAHQPDYSRPVTQSANEINQPGTDESNIPDNQENVPDNEEHLQNLPHKMNQMKISSTHNLDSWSNSPGWENQEVAPRCELDRNQYLETGQLDSNETEEVAVEPDNNDEGEALPPPGLDRMVTGQGPESISQRSVQGGGNGYVRMVPGQPTPRSSPEPSSLERLVPGQQNNEEISLNASQRMVPGQQTLDTQPSMRFANLQDQQNELHRLVPGQTQNETSLGLRMVTGQLSDDDTNLSTNDLERFMPVGTSEHDNNLTRDEPGGMSDGSRSQSMSIDEDTRASSEPVMTESNLPPPDTGRLVTGAGAASVDIMTPPVGQSIGHQDVNRHVIGHSNNGSGDSAAQPPPGLHRLVLGQINSETVPDPDTATVSGKQGERSEDSAGGNPPPGMHRMVVGQFRENEPDIDDDKEKDNPKNVDREEDSDSDYRSDRRRHRHRKDSFDDDRKERDYSNEREYRGKREERREYRKKRDDSYNRSPDFRSDHEEYERNDYRDRRDRDRRDRPRDRERRRRSPEYNYDPYYRDDPRKQPPRERDRRYYEPYDDDPYYYRENRSRPSSRSGSDYRRHRDYPPRQPYYQDQGYMHYYQIQQYYENMRRTDPQAYALWYERYMAEKFGAASNDRVSVSGRSSVNENSQTNEKWKFSISKASTPVASPARSVQLRSRHLTHNWSFTSLPTRLEEDTEDIKADDAASHRSTPPLYNSTHIRGQFNTLGQLIIINPHDPFSYGEHQAKITICKVAGPNVADTPDTLEFLSNPGPFISGVTHKNTVLQYLKKQSDQFSHSSEKLLYELIRLVIKLNGVVDMTDVADLLIESYRNSNPEAAEYCQEAPQEVEESSPLSPLQVTTKFRDLLLEGNKTEALEWAMKNKDWGHALFLASKMDSRTHNNVMLRFANGLQTNDPLQTLYQLMSGREPQAATCAADKKWGDWRPHLAMMLSNRTANLELDRKAILTLGDSLGARGRLYASHFCYLTAQLEFSKYSNRHAKLVLLGASHDKPFAQFASCRSIMLTLCYEYAKQLSNKEWCIPTLRPYKFLLACRLFDHGNIPASLAYLEALAQEIVRLPGRDDRPLMQVLIDMADKIKCADSSLVYSTEPTSDPDWLARLKYHYEETSDPNYLSSNLVHGISTSTVSELEPCSAADSVPQTSSVQDVNQVYAQEVNNYHPDVHNAAYVADNYYDPSQNNYYNPSQNIIPTQENHKMTGYSSEQQPLTVDSSAVDYWSPPTANTGWEQQQLRQDEPPMETQPAVDVQPQISVKPGFGYYGRSEEMIMPQVQQPASTAPILAAGSSDKTATSNKDKSSRRTNKTQQSGSGWFGGIWDKLALRPKNQMKLPDDKNPSIVWDEKTKKWVNTDTTEEEQSHQLKPPPKASELNGSLVNASAPVPAAASTPAIPPTHAVVGGVAPTANMGLPPLSSASANKYKLQRGKGMRSNYVDVMGPNKKPTAAAAGSNSQPFTAMPQAPMPNFFVPAPIAGNENAPVDFLSPSGPVSYEPSSSKSDDALPPGGYAKGNSAFYNTSSYQT